MSTRLARVSTRLAAAPGDVAALVLMPGDPLCARWVAQSFLDHTPVHVGLVMSGDSFHPTRLELSAAMVEAALSPTA